jgi:hypothetical protein
MTDIEITKKIASLTWEVDLAAGTVKSDLIHYKIVPGDGYVDLESVWISPDIPPVQGVIFSIQKGALAAYQKKLEEKGRKKDVR